MSTLLLGAGALGPTVGLLGAFPKPTQPASAHCNRPPSQGPTYTQRYLSNENAVCQVHPDEVGTPNSPVLQVRTH